MFFNQHTCTCTCTSMLSADEEREYIFHDLLTSSPLNLMFLYQCLKYKTLSNNNFFKTTLYMDLSILQATWWKYASGILLHVCGWIIKWITLWPWTSAMKFERNMRGDIIRALATWILHYCHWVVLVVPLDMHGRTPFTLTCFGFFL